MSLLLQNLRELIKESDSSVKRKKKKKKKRKKKEDDQSKWTLRKRKKVEKKRVPTIERKIEIKVCEGCQYFFNDMEFQTHKTTCSVKLKQLEEEKKKETPPQNVNEEKINDEKEITHKNVNEKNIDSIPLVKITNLENKEDEKN